MVDTTQNIQAKFETVAGDANMTQITIARALDTGDSQDYVLPLDTEFEMAWALGADTSFTTMHIQNA